MSNLKNRLKIEQMLAERFNVAELLMMYEEFGYGGKVAPETLVPLLVTRFYAPGMVPATPAGVEARNAEITRLRELSRPPFAAGDAVRFKGYRTPTFDFPSVQPGATGTVISAKQPGQVGMDYHVKMETGAVLCFDRDELEAVES